MEPSSQTHPEVAVVVPCYNAEHCLKRALDSVFAQTYRDFRIYAVDDGSVDNTPQILAAYAGTCSVAFQPHSGPATARNRAIQMSRSPFIAFQDADDEWVSNKLEKQIALLKQDPSLGLVCSYCLLKGHETVSSSSLGQNDFPHSGNLFQYVARTCFILTPSVVVRRRCLEEVGLFNESFIVGDDLNLWLRIAARWRIAIMPEELVIVHKWRGSLSTTIQSEERLRMGVDALAHVQSVCTNLSTDEQKALRRALAEKIYFYGSFLLASGKRDAARQKLKSVLEYQPAHWRAIAKLGLSFLPGRSCEFLLGLGKETAH